METDDCMGRRQAILQKAKELADQGAHYLWGGKGQIPTPGGSVQLAPPELSADNLTDTTFCAATNTVGKVVYVCAGRFKHAALVSQSPQSKIAIAQGQQPDENSQSVKALRKFIVDWSGSLEKQKDWDGAKGLTPRAVRGDSITDYSDPKKPDLVGAVVWGEGCDGTRHFDCRGFVNKVVQEVCHTNVEGIEAVAKGAAGPLLYGQPMGLPVQPGDTVQPADILVYPGHVAFAIGGPGTAFALGGSYAVAQANSAVYGVDYGSLMTGHLIGCVRLTEVALLNRPPPP